MIGVYLDDDNWTGHNNGDTFTLYKFKKRTGWVIDFQEKWNTQNQNIAFSNLTDDKVEDEFFKIIRDTNLL